MTSHGIRDRVAIVGMGCTAFGEHWTKSADDLLIEAAEGAVESAGIDEEIVRTLVPMLAELGAPHADDRDAILDAVAGHAVLLSASDAPSRSSCGRRQP